MISLPRILKPNNYIFHFFIRPPPLAVSCFSTLTFHYKGGPVMDNYLITFREILSLLSFTPDYSMYVR